jgi:hypothetical protein
MVVVVVVAVQGRKQAGRKKHSSLVDERVNDLQAFTILPRSSVYLRVVMPCG